MMFRRQEKIIAGLLFIGLISSFSWGANELPEYGRIANFRLTSQAGKPFTDKDLKGEIWVADFIYTRCSDECPLLSHRMSQLQKLFAGNPRVKFVSFTLDPWYDSPAVLSRYASHYAAKPGKWFFLTGSSPQIAQVGVKSFHFFTAQQFKQNQVGSFHHSDFFALLDAQGNIRGYYDSGNKTDWDKLIQNVRSLSR